MMTGPAVAIRSKSPQYGEHKQNDLYDNYDSTNNNQLINNVITRINTADIMNKPRPMTNTIGSLYGSQPPATVTNRPMTAVKSAGFTSNNQLSTNHINNTTTQSNSIPPLIKITDTIHGNAHQMELAVHKLLEQSATAASNKNFTISLDAGKSAGLAERKLVKYRELHKLEQNIDLTYSILLNLGIQYTNNALHYNDQSMYNSALHVYQTILNKPEFPYSRVRVNMGGVYYMQKKYVLAIKCYRIAMDSLHGNSRLRQQLMCNIGLSLIRLHQYNDAVHNYESCHDDPSSAYNLCLCYYMNGEVDKLKQQYVKLIHCTEYQTIARELANSISNDNTAVVDQQQNDTMAQQLQVHHDELQANRATRQKQLYHYIYVISKLIAPLIVSSGNLEDGYNWCITQLYTVDSNKNNAHDDGNENKLFSHVAHELNISKSIQYIQQNNLQSAITVLNTIDSTDKLVYAHAAINLSYISYLKSDMGNALKYADIAAEHDRYNASALVNKANCKCELEQYTDARELYLESIGVESNCYNAIYNLGICNKRSEQYEDALQAFNKLYRMNNSDIYVCYQLGCIHELMGDYIQAIEYLNLIHNTVTNDSELLYKLGTLHDRLSHQPGINQSTHTQHAYHYYIESYQLNCTNIDVISWLGVYCVVHQQYDDAIQYFIHASTIESNQPKWLLMTASCYRRVADIQQSIVLYTRVLETEYTDELINKNKNIECLKYLLVIYRELNDQQHIELYQSMLDRYDVELPPNQSTTPPSSNVRPISAIKHIQPESMQPSYSAQPNIYDARSELHHRQVSQPVNSGVGGADNDEWNTLDTEQLLI